MPAKTTPEQRAVKIVEWLGYELFKDWYGRSGHRIHTTFVKEFIWSPEGEGAMIRGILRSASIYLEVYEFDPDLVELQTEHFDKTKFKKDAEIIGKPLNEALQLAIWEMIDGR